MFDWTSARAFWTVGQIVRALGRAVAPSTVRSWCAQGLLEAVRTPGGHYRVPSARLRAFLFGPANTDAADHGSPTSAPSRGLHAA